MAFEIRVVVWSSAREPALLLPGTTATAVVAAAAASISAVGFVRSITIQMPGARRAIPRLDGRSGRGRVGLQLQRAEPAHVDLVRRVDRADRPRRVEHDVVRV